MTTPHSPQTRAPKNQKPVTKAPKPSEAREEGGVLRPDPARPPSLRSDVAEPEAKQDEVPDECGNRQLLQPDAPLKDDAVRAIFDMMRDDLGMPVPRSEASQWRGPYNQPCSAVLERRGCRSTMNATRRIGAVLLGLALNAGAQSAVEKYDVETPTLEAKLPVYVKTLNEFVVLGREVAYSKSYEEVLKRWMRRNAQAPPDTPPANAWILIEEDGVAVFGHWRMEQPVGAGKAARPVAAPLHEDEFPMVEAIQRYAIKESGFPKVVGIEVRMVIWSGFPNATLSITHNRLAMHWTVHLRKDDRKAEEWLRVFPAKPKEDGKTLGKSGLKLLYLWDGTREDDDEWSRIIQSGGSSKEGD